jgi:hypothetical protein
LLLVPYYTFDIEDGGRIFCRNFGGLLPMYITPQKRVIRSGAGLMIII